MFFKRFAVLLILPLCFFCSDLFAQGTSNKGTDFWLGYGNHVQGELSRTQRMDVYITSDVNTKGTITIPGVGDQLFTVTANEISKISIPLSAYLEATEVTVPVKKGIHITAEKPVVVYSHIHYAAVSGATLVLPTSTLGKEYYSINYTQTSNQANSYSYFFVIAVEDNTQIVITPSAANKNGLQPGVQSKAISLNKGEIYQVLGTSSGLSGTDLTGSIIKSVSTTSEPCKKIAVFSGSGKITIGCATGGDSSADNLYQEVYPTATWGNKFITAPLKGRGYDIFRIVKSDPTAVVTLNGAIVQFTNNLYYDFNSQEVNRVESDKPIQVVQYAVTQRKGINCTTFAEAVGDPEMIFLNPLEQTLTNITMYSSPDERITAHFINVVMKTESAATFKLDGVGRGDAFITVPGQPEYSYAQLSVSAGTHNLSASGGFNAIAYGFGSAESYGYAAGANLISKGIEALDSKLKIATTGCVNEPFTLQIPMPYQPASLKVDFGKGDGPQTVTLKQTGSYQEKDKTYFVYELGKNVSFDQVKTYSIQVFATKATSDGCGSIDEFDLEFPVYAPPSANFTSAAEVCAGSSITFTDKSTDPVNKLAKWIWDFDDGTLSTEQNPVHAFASRKTYNVKLTVSGETGCTSNTFISSVIVNALPIAKFTYSSPDCETKEIVFTDASTSQDGALTSWTWDFGDGSAATVNTTNAAVPHTFTKSGTYTVTLKVATAKSCENTFTSANVIIYPQPVAGFDMPGICQADGTARFTNTSTITGDVALSYLWNFGDNAQNITALNQNTSTLANPSHSYALAGDYMVTLSVTSANGCGSSISQLFTVNGSTPQARFTVQSPAGLCSNQPVSFVDNSSVSPGSLTKIVWYFDDGNASAPALTVLKPVAGKAYTYTYPSFSSPATRSVSVRLVAYSGTACADVNIQTITLKAVPIITFDPVLPVCMEKSPFQLAANAAFYGTGSGAYSGDGTTSGGLFDPAKAGAGDHIITYTYTATNGCQDQKSQVITVYRTPTVNAGKDAFILQGGETVLDPKVTGSNLTYKWTPVTGLSDPAAARPVASPLEDITYTVTVTSDQGCSAADEIFVKVLKSPIVPNTFTPNGDGINDLWNIQYLESYPNATVKIFNRYGGEMLAEIGYSRAWDGTSNGVPVPVGVYYYIIDPKNGRKLIYGSVTVIR